MMHFLDIRVLIFAAWTMGPTPPLAGQSDASRSPTVSDTTSEMHSQTLQRTCLALQSKLEGQNMRSLADVPHDTLRLIGRCTITGGAIVARLWNTATIESTHLARDSAVLTHLMFLSASIRDRRIEEATTRVAQDSRRAFSLRLAALYVLVSYETNVIGHVSTIYPNRIRHKDTAAKDTTLGWEVTDISFRPDSLIQRNGVESLLPDYRKRVRRVIERVVLSSYPNSRGQFQSAKHEKFFDRAKFILYVYFKDLSKIPS